MRFSQAAGCEPTHHAEKWWCYVCKMLANDRFEQRSHNYRRSVNLGEEVLEMTLAWDGMVFLCSFLSLAFLSNKLNTQLDLLDSLAKGPLWSCQAKDLGGDAIR